MLFKQTRAHFCSRLLKPISKTYSIYVTFFAFGKVNVEFRRNGPVSDRKPVTNPNPPKELLFVLFRFYPWSDDEAETFIRVYEQRNQTNPLPEILTHIFQKTSDAKVLTEAVLVIQPYSKGVLMLLMGISQEKPNVVAVVVRFLMLSVLFLGCESL